MEVVEHGGNGAVSSWTAIVVNRNGSIFLEDCLRALTSTDPAPESILLVDNASDDDSLQELAAWPQVEVEASSRHLGIAGAVNLGLRLVDAPIVAVLQPFVEVQPEFGARLLSAFRRSSDLGAAVVELSGADGNQSRDEWAKPVSALVNGWAAGARDAVESLSSAAMVLRRGAVQAIGGFDERFWPEHFEDADLAVRLEQAGWRVRRFPGLRATVSGVLPGNRLPDELRWFHRNRLRFALKHLDSRTWWSEFLPQEIGRLRGELSGELSQQWTDRTGAQAVEWLARVGVGEGRDPGSLIDLAPLHQVAEAVARARGSLPPELEGRSRSGFRWSRARRTASRQAEFNEAVLRALEAQDRLNRELVTQLLLLGLEVAYLRAGGDDARHASE